MDHYNHHGFLSSSNTSPTRRPALHQRTESESNSHTVAAIRIVPKTPPRLLGYQPVTGKDPIALAPPPLPSIVGAGERGFLTGSLDNNGFQHNTKAQNASGRLAASSPRQQQVPEYSQSIYSASSRPTSPTSSTHSRPKPRKKRLHIHEDNKTFSLLQDDSISAAESSKSPSLSLSSTKASSTFPLPDDQYNAQGWDNLKDSCVSTRILTGSTFSIPSTPAPKKQEPIAADPIAGSPWNYQFVGGLRKVSKTPDLKEKASSSIEHRLPLPSISDDPFPASHDLATKPSFRSTDTESSEKTNYKVYRADSVSPSNHTWLPPSSSESEYQSIREPSPASTVIKRPQTAESENENYEVYGDSSPAGPYLDLVRHSQYSQESLVVQPLKTRPRRKRSNKSGAHKPKSTRSRDSLRSPSITSISTVFSQREALRAIVGRGSQIQLPIPLPRVKTSGTGSWAELPILHPPRLHMNEHPHQWSSQLSTVLSISDSGTDRGSQSWSEDNGRRSSNFDTRSSGRRSQGQIMNSASEADPMSPMSRTDSRSASRGMSRGESSRAVSRDSLIEPPQSYFGRQARFHSNSSVRMVQDLDEDGDGITDMRDLRTRPSRRRMSGLLSSSSSENGRTNTMRSTTSTRANSLLASSIPAWARLYYGSGERRYLGALGSSTPGTNTRSSSFRSGSPNTDHYPDHIYSPRRRPRDGNRRGDGRGSLDIHPAPLYGADGRLINDPYSRRYRTWSLSSLWSPHLRHDRRAHHPSVWEPPSVNWSTAGGVFGRRNIQIIMFILGFVFPFAWMIASFLPLPQLPKQDMQELDIESRPDLRNTLARHQRRYDPLDEARYESAVWWRKLNRWMSFVGVLILASVIVLVVIGVKENWGVPRSPPA